MNRRYAWYVVGVLTLANVSGFIDRQILSLLAVPMRRDLDLTLTEFSYLDVAFALFFTVMGLPIARLADSWSRRNIIAVGIALWSIMTALCGLAGTFRRLLVARVGVGVGEAALSPPVTSILADYFPRERLNTALSVYSMGVFIGSGFAYFIGGLIVGIAASREMWQWPLVGDIRPWQTVFIIIGLPGLLIALLVLTVREPERGDHSRGTFPLATTLAYVRANARTFACHSLGFALSASVNYGIARWLATFLIETHGMTAQRAGMLQGTLTMTVGTLGVLAGGRLADALVRRGHTDAALRVGIVGALGMLVSATAYALTPSTAAVIAWLVVVNFFAAFPWGAASAAAAEIVPAAMRAQGAALYFFVLSLVATALGPWSVAAVTDYVFRDDAALRYGLAIVNVVGMLGAIGLFVLGMPAYRRTLALRDTWSVSAA